MIYTNDYTTYEQFDEQIRSDPTNTDVLNDYDLVRQYIQQASNFFSRITMRTFVPYIFVHEVEASRQNFDASSRFLWMPDDCLSVTSVANTDGSIIASTLYRLRNQYLSPNQQLELNANARITNLSSDNFISRYEITGIWGYHRNYDNAWIDTTTISANITTTTATTFDVASVADLERLQYIRINSEYMQITGAIPTIGTTLTVKRGVNGSTATTHISADEVDIWFIEPEVQLAVTRLAAGLYRTRHNAGNQLRFIDGSVLVEGDDKTPLRIARKLLRTPRIRAV